MATLASGHRALKARPYFSIACTKLILMAIASCSTEHRDNPEAKLEEGTHQVSSGLFDLTCRESRADQCTECREDSRRRAEECYAITTDIITSGGYSPVSACNRIGDSSHCNALCGRSSDECVAFEHKFVPNLKASPSILEACELAQARDTRCDEVTVGPACEVYAMVERPEVEDAYRCTAETPCGESPSPCFERFHKPTNIADILAELCEDSLDAETRERLDLQASWNTDQAIEGLLECPRMYCGTGEVQRCVEAWISGVTGSSDD